MKKVGIYGGSFNPIHVGHIALARKLLEKASLDEIWFIVSPLNPLKKQSDLVDDAKRLELVDIALQDEKGLIASDYEFHLPKPSYMLHTLKSLSHDFANVKFTLLIGADNWERFNEWFGYQDIIDQYNIVIYPREGNEVDTTQLPETVKMIDTELYNISSTEIREKISQGQSIKGMVPDSIIDKVIDYWK